MVKTLKITFLSSMIICALFGIAQAQEVKIEESEVPFKVQAKFYGKYKEAANVKWKSVDDNKFAAMFYTKNRRITAKYDSRGKILEVENVSQKATFSEEVDSHLKDRFPGAKVHELRKITRYYVEGTTGPQHYYELILKEGKRKTSVFFDGEMQLMKADNIFNLAVN